MDSDAPNKKIVYGNRQRGAEVHIDQNGKTEISLLDNANLYSLHYATAHVFLSSLIEIAEGGGTPSVAMKQQITADLQALREFAEAQRHKLPVGADRLEWQAVPISGSLTNEQLKTLHEVTAIAYVKYLMQGEAPSSGLENAFSSIKNSLQEEGNLLPDITLSPEVAQVFDRMLATDEDIQRKKAPRQLADQPTSQPISRQPVTRPGICAKILSRATTVTRRVGLLCLAFGVAFWALGLVTWGRYYELYDLEEFHGIMMLLGTVLAPIGAFLYSGMADRLFSWLKTGK